MQVIGLSTTTNVFMEHYFEALQLISIEMTRFKKFCDFIAFNDFCVYVTLFSYRPMALGYNLNVLGMSQKISFALITTIGSFKSELVGKFFYFYDLRNW